MTDLTIQPIAVNISIAAQMLGVSESTFQGLTRTEPLLKPVLIGARNARYPVERLREYVATRPVSDIAPPEGSGYGQRGKVAV